MGEPVTLLSKPGTGQVPELREAQFEALSLATSVVVNHRCPFDCSKENLETWGGGWKATGSHRLLLDPQLVDLLGKDQRRGLVGGGMSLRSDFEISKDHSISSVLSTSCLCLEM